jgi:ribosomal protein L11 methyltransferase
MEYIQITFVTADTEIKEVLIARLGEVDYYAFEETDDALHAFILPQDYNEAILTEIAATYHLSPSVNTIKQQNWNAIWEADFQPIIVDDFCTIRAHFHDMPITTLHEIVITPKMSFGTGHHATTLQMIKAMRNINWNDVNVLDFGTGTGILAILANMKGAKKVIAIDNDEWSYENAIENVERNNCNNVTVNIGSIEDVSHDQFDVILANINKNILLQYALILVDKMKAGGTLLISGIIEEDRSDMIQAYEQAGLHLVDETELSNWLMLKFSK